MLLINAMTNDLAEQLYNWATFILSWSVILAALGAMVMALLEVVKAVFPVRRWFHRYSLVAWIELGIPSIWRWLRACQPQQKQALTHELLQVAAGGVYNADAFHDQESAKLFDELRSAVRLAIDFPHSYPLLYCFLTAGAEDDAKQWWEITTRRSGASAPPDHVLANALRARLDNLVSRKITAVQTGTEYRWTRVNQRVSVAAGTVLF